MPSASANVCQGVALMRIVIQARGFSLTGGWQQHIEQRFCFALDRARFQALRVSIRLSVLIARVEKKTTCNTS